MNLLRLVGGGIARGVLQAVGLPRARSVRPASAAEAAAYAEAADLLLAAGGPPVERADLPQPRFPCLCWLAENRPVLFHGSARDDIDQLAPVRLSRDTSAFGDQQAVYATSDRIWAAWFAVVARDRGFRGMRNASIGLGPDGRVYPRWYFFSVNRADDSPPRFGPGTLYLLPADGFTPERREYGIADTGQLVRLSAVRPVARVTIDAADVPFIDATVTHRQGDGELRTMLAFGRATRRRGRASRSLPADPGTRRA